MGSLITSLGGLGGLPSLPGGLGGNLGGNLGGGANVFGGLGGNLGGGLTGKITAGGFSPDFAMNELQEASKKLTGGLIPTNPNDSNNPNHIGLDNLTDSLGSGGGTQSATQHFGQLLQEELSKLNQTQSDAQTAAQDYAAGGEISIHQVMLAMNKAEISLSLATQVRNRLVGAYQEISRMPL